MDLAEIANLTLIEETEIQAISRPEWDTVLRIITQPPNDTQYTDDYEDPDNSSVIWYFAHPDYESYSMAEKAVYICTQLGLLSVVLNLFVVVALIRNRHRVLLNVFYVIVLHCAILDVVRGACLIVNGLPTLAQSVYRGLGYQLHYSITAMFIKASSFALIILRICNLLTIFNLLVFTTNEFIVIRYPLHYRRYFRRRAVLVILACCWIVSIIMGLGLFVPKAPHHARHQNSNDENLWHIDLQTVSMLLISVLCMLVLAIVMVCYGFILRTIRRFKEESLLNTEDSHKHNRGSLHKSNSNGSAANGNKMRIFKLQTMQRHKYIYVIGTVLVVDLLFLCPYSGIQLVSFLHINRFMEITPGSSFIRWWLQVLIGIHSVCQPLCYFRMNEFRRLACCGGRGPWNRSKTFSQVNRSFGNTRSAAREDEEAREDVVFMDAPLLEANISNPSSVQSYGSPSSHTRVESVRFRTYGNEYAQKVVIRDGSYRQPKELVEAVEMKAIQATSQL